MRGEGKPGRNVLHDSRVRSPRRAYPCLKSDYRCSACAVKTFDVRPPPWSSAFLSVRRFRGGVPLRRMQSCSGATTSIQSRNEVSRTFYPETGFQDRSQLTRRDVRATTFLRNRARNFLSSLPPLPFPPRRFAHRFDCRRARGVCARARARGGDLYTVLITVFLPVHRARSENRRTRGASESGKNAKARAANAILLGPVDVEKQ